MFLGQKNFGSNFFSHKILWVKKNLGSKKILGYFFGGKNKFWGQNFLSQKKKILVKKYFRGKKFRVTNFFVKKMFW